jgi:hypothetical protein
VGVGERATRGKGTTHMAMATLVDRLGLPFAICAASATPHEVTLVAVPPPTRDSRFVTELPERLIGGRTYDADPLDEVLAELGIEMIAPHCRGRTRPKTRDGRPCAVTGGAGKWNGSSPGWAISAGSSSATNVMHMRSTFWASSTLGAFSSCSVRLYAVACRSLDTVARDADRPACPGRGHVHHLSYIGASEALPSVSIWRQLGVDPRAAADVVYSAPPGSAAGPCTSSARQRPSS